MPRRLGPSPTRSTALALHPRSGAKRLDDYFGDWLPARLVRGKALAPSTRAGYERLWRRNVEAALGRKQLRAVTPEVVRSWYGDPAAKAGRDQAAKSYRLVRAVLATAEADGLVRSNPCKMRGAGQEHHDERPMVPTALVLDLADAIEARYRALVLLAGFAGLRTGENLGLRPVRHRPDALGGHRQQTGAGDRWHRPPGRGSEVRRRATGGGTPPVPRR